ncbi:hypothetical protein KTE47_10890 [Burkholderia multivorans]|uniref:hypothetical protein n=1 Tax=Burkholderia multivorans TaxID=87883 RepID=UPI001C2103CE|nr:hypothetical protein [Burkholderia multivorans]MBU9618108.1 hypothetical protein [Burkholderia multivorans]
MSEIKNGGPAFPGKASINRSTGELQAHQFGNNDFETLGMSLLDYFAGKALIGLLAEPIVEGIAPSSINCTPNFDSDGAQPGDRIATAAYALAAAMLRARGAA